MATIRESDAIPSMIVICIIGFIASILMGQFEIALGSLAGLAIALLRAYQIANEKTKAEKRSKEYERNVSNIKYSDITSIPLLNKSSEKDKTAKEEIIKNYLNPGKKNSSISLNDEEFKLLWKTNFKTFEDAPISDSMKMILTGQLTFSADKSLTLICLKYYFEKYYLDITKELVAEFQDDFIKSSHKYFVNSQ